MVIFVIRRLIGTIFLLIVVSMITFAIFFLIPRLAGQTTYQLASQYVGRNPTRQAVLQVEQQLGLADPLYLQYGRFLKGIVLGVNYRAGPTVTYWSSSPGWSPWSCSATSAFLYAALYARLTRAGMLETMSEDYIRAARAKGLPEHQVIVKHGLRAALTPIVTIFGMDLGLLLGGAILTEVTFSMHGLGVFTVEAIQNQDLPEILGVTMLDSPLDTASANAAAGIRGRLGVSVADSHMGAVIQSAPHRQITVVTSDPGGRCQHVV